MSNEKEVRDYRKEKSLELIEKYKDLISKTFTVINRDILENEIKKADEGNENENEQKYLKKIKSRKQSLDEVVLMVDKIEELERHTKEEDDIGANETTVKITSNSHPSKRHARK
jgi:PP-loop superfamily ATP-utilizing enzyme